MNLGQLMNRLEHEADAGAALEALQDLVLLAEVQAAGVEHGESPGEYVANASRRFAALASDEDWLGVMNAMERTQDPARAAIDRMLRWALKRDAAPPSEGSGKNGSEGCGCGGGGGCHGHA
jgi:hypothetical protein